jgi:hypothetical protein
MRGFVVGAVVGVLLAGAIQVAAQTVGVTKLPKDVNPRSTCSDTTWRILAGRLNYFSSRIDELIGPDAPKCELKALSEAKFLAEVAMGYEEVFTLVVWPKSNWQNVSDAMSRSVLMRRVVEERWQYCVR